MASRNVTTAQIAASFTAAERLARPLVDKTGLDGSFDFTLESIRESNNLLPPDFQEGTTFPVGSARATWIETEVYKGNNGQP
jgi:uncharacterized protein (TIGR03435 family)